MSKDVKNELSDSIARKTNAKSTDLKRRLFQIGVSNSPKSSLNSQLLPHSGSPKNSLFNRSVLAMSPKQKYSQVLLFKPSHSPQLMKTTTKDFHIRKSPKSPFSPQGSHKQATTLNAFYRPDSIRGEQQQIKQALLGAREKLEHEDHYRQVEQHSQSRLDEYVRLILRGVEKIDQFMYLVRGSEENIYELELVDFETVRNHEGEPDFEYYTVSRKGFCQYVGGKPQNFIDIAEWAQEKALYSNIKALKFFFRFRRWKTLQMWRRTVTRQRRETIAHCLQEKMFLLEPTARRTLLQLRKLTLQMEKSILIIARNQGGYTIQSFKHCQERARREASLAVQQFSRQSRTVVRKCFQNKLSQLRENIKKNSSEEKLPSNNPLGAQSPKQGAFQALGFPSKMTYQHRSRLRKQAGRFLRFSYLVDSLHLSCLAGIYSSQVQAFVSRFQQLQLNQPVRLRMIIEEGKEQINSQKRFALQLLCSFKQVPASLICEGSEGQEFLPSKGIRLKDNPPESAYWVYRICDHWLSMQPNLDQVLDELTFLLRQGLISLKCFQRWAKHRDMQKYVSVLEQWDDLVSQNWQISQNDNLDPLLLLDSLDPILTRLKSILKITQDKILDTIRNNLTSLLNAYWEYSRIDLQRLQSPALANPAETFEHFLSHTSRLLERVTNELPHRLQMGVFTLHITRIKNILGQKFAGILQNLKVRLPQLVEQRTSILNDWLTAFGARLRQEILSIDDYVRLVGVIKMADAQFGQRRDQCNQLAQLYQTMQVFKMDTRKRKDFQAVTLKLKDQLDQLLIAAEQNIERKADLYTRQVLKYHLPALLTDIAKALEVAQQPKFLKLQMSKHFVLADLRSLQIREKELIQQRGKCDLYMQALKIQGQNVGALDQLSKQISDRVRLWQTLQEWQNFVKANQGECVKNQTISQLIQKVKQYRQITRQLDFSLPPNEVLTYLKQKVQEYYIYLPLLQGFAESLSESHWNQIYEILPERFSLDLKKRQFKLKDFLSSGIGSNAKQIQHIFEKSRVEAKLQNQYQQLEEHWANLVAKIKTEGRFNIICNEQVLRQQLNKILMQYTQMVADPHAQSLKQYSITYQGLISTQQALEQWIRLQKKIIEIQKLCRLLDIKKLADYNYFQNAERIYKQMTKATTVKGAQLGVRLGKLIGSVTDDKIAEIDLNLAKVQDNIKSILFQHRKLFPAFYLFEDSQLLRLITQPTHQLIQQATRKLLPGVKKLQIQNERITTVITIDGDRFFKNPISTNSQIQQILFNIGQTISEIHKRTMRTCRYKAIENNLSSLVQFHNIQHLLAVNRVDFSQYTTISVENQQQTPESLAQFRKVMRKDTAQDIKSRQFLKDNQNENNEQNRAIMYKYDTLLLQQLVHEEILDQLIRSNIQRPQEFIWASQLKFYWEDTAADQQNITIRQFHLSLKYGNDFLGSNTKVIIQSEVELLLGLKLGEPVVFTGNSYALQRLFNAMGYKMLNFTCSPSTNQLVLRNFLIGCCFSDYLPVLNLADLLPLQLKNSIGAHTWVNQFKTSFLKKNSPYIRQLQHPYTLFATLRSSSTAIYNFGGSFRVVNYRPPKSEFLKSGMQLLGAFGQEKTNIFLRIFSAVRFIEQRSDMQGVSLERFMDETLFEQVNEEDYKLFSRLLVYLKPKISLQTYEALEKHLQSLGLVPLSTEKLFTRNRLNNLVKFLWQRHIVIYGGRGRSKKHFLKAESDKNGIQIVDIFGQILDCDSQQLKNYFVSLSKQYQNKEKCIFYIENVTTGLLLALEKLVFFDNFLTIHQPKIAIVLDIPIIDKFVDPHSLSSFLVFNYQNPKEYIASLLSQWTAKFFEEERQKQVIRILQQIVIPTLQNLNSKDQHMLQQKFVKFLKHLQSLLPFKNILQASIYTLGMLYRGYEQQELKLQYQTKKHMGDDYFGQGTHISNLVYSKLTQKQGMVTQNFYFETWTSENYFKDKDYIMTPQIIHLLTAARRIHDKTQSSVFLEGRGNSGKTTCLQIYRQLYHQNSFYISISSKENKNWNRKINLTLQKHGINVYGARINYKQTVIMIEDVHFAERKDLLPLQLMTQYKQIKNDNNGIMKLKNVKFVFTATSVPSNLQKYCLRLKVRSSSQQIKNIFITLLKQNCDSQWQVQPQFWQKIVNVSYDLCKRINQQTQLEMKEAFTCLKRIIGGFGKLKIKQGNNAQKQLEKFWSFALLQSLKSYDNNQQILQKELKKQELSVYNSSPLSYTHLNARPNDKRIQNLRDPKRLYNALNQKIEKYNQGDIKRYGDSFQFINFDSVLQKIISISHSILLSKDHMLVGRDGSGKESLVKLAAFLNGLHFREITQSIKNTIMDMLDATVPTPYLLLKKINTLSDQNWLQQYCYCDFQSEILGQNEGKPRVGTREKEKQMLGTKSTRNNFMASQTYTMPKAKLSWQEATAFKQSFRLVVTMTKRDEIKNISKQVRSNFHFDLIDEVPVTSILQYNQKLLAVDGVSCGKDSLQLLSNIYKFSREQLGISLRANDDCVRLFSSFIANLISEMKIQAQKFGKILQLLKKLRACCTIINASLCQAHSRLKQLSLVGQSSRESKAQIEAQLRQKSTAFSVGEKLVEILSWLQPYYTNRYNSIQGHLQNHNQLQLTFATTASYFIYLSNKNYGKRRQMFKKWISNIPLMANLPQINSFLPLFLLYQQQFNAEPVDDLQELFQNMAIIFHSAKPIAIDDICNRGRAWLQKNCSFVYLRQDQKEFNEQLSDLLTKATNILIEVTQQETMNKLSETIIGTLLFLPESANNINIKGQEIQVHHEAKVYMLIGKGVTIPKNLMPQFTIVRYQENPKLAEISLTHQYLCYTQREAQIKCLDLSRKIRSLKLECQVAISQVAQSIYEQLCGTEALPAQNVLVDQLTKITDKLMVKAQNQFTKIRDKEDLASDFKEKYQSTFSKMMLEPAQQFYRFSSKISKILNFMAQKSHNQYPHPSYAEFFQTLRLGLAKGIITNIFSLILFTIRQWGPLYSRQDYLIFNLLLIMAYQNIQIQEINTVLTSQGVRTGALLALIHRQPQPLLNQNLIQEQIGEALTDIFRQQDFKSITPFLGFTDNIFEPIYWSEGDCGYQPKQKIIKIVSKGTQAQIRQKMLNINQRILQPSQQESLESLLKKSGCDQVLVLAFSRNSALEYQKILKNWNMLENSIIYINDTKAYKISSQQVAWQVNLDNPQLLFRKIIDSYIELMQITQPSQPQAPEEIAQTPTISHRVSTHSSYQCQQNLQSLCDRFYNFIQSLVTLIKKQLQQTGLPVPQFKKNQLLLLRKSVQNNDNSLTLVEKVQCIIQYINQLINVDLSQIQTFLKNTFARIIKAAQKSDQQDFFTEIQSILVESKGFKEDPQDQEIELISMELGWLARTRKFMGLTNTQLADRYIRQIQPFLKCYQYGRETPQVSRGSKRQINIKNRRDSVARKGRESMSLSKKLDKKLMSTPKAQTNQLACIHLLKQSEEYERILHQINKDLEEAREELQNFSYLPNQSTLRLLLKVLQNQPTPNWKYLFAKIGCTNMPLALGLRHIISRRNEIYTSYNKFTVNDGFELDFKYMQHPIEFLKVYFGTEITSRDVFLVSSVLTTEEADREYLRIGGLWSYGWKLNAQGFLEHVGDNKSIQIGSCFLIKKQTVGLGFCPVDVYLHPESSPFMRVYCVSKKLQSGYKLYLRNDN